MLLTYNLTTIKPFLHCLDYYEKSYTTAYFLGAAVLIPLYIAADVFIGVAVIGTLVEAVIGDKITKYCGKEKDLTFIGISASRADGSTCRI